MSAVSQSERREPLPHPSDAPPFSGDFVNGRPHVHSDGTQVNFTDDTWAHSIEPRRVLYFDTIPLWLRDLVKLYIAHRWLDENKTPNYLYQALSAARWWAATLSDFTGASLADLTPDHARRVRSRLEHEADVGREILEQAEASVARPLTQRERRAALRNTDGRLSPKLPPLAGFETRRGLNHLGFPIRPQVNQVIFPIRIVLRNRHASWCAARAVDGGVIEVDLRLGAFFTAAFALIANAACCSGSTFYAAARSRQASGTSAAAHEGEVRKSR